MQLRIASFPLLAMPTPTEIILLHNACFLVLLVHSQILFLGIALLFVLTALGETIENAKPVAKLQAPQPTTSLSSARPSAPTTPTPTSESAMPPAQVLSMPTITHISVTLPVP